MADAAGPPTPLAIIAGRGRFPREIAERRARAGLPYLLIVFQDCYEDWMSAHPHERHEFERAGAVFRSLRRAAATHVAFAGNMSRPRLRPWRADLTAVRLLPRVLALMRGGDDGLLRGLAAIFEREGLIMIDPREVLGQQATVPAGALGQRAPREADLADAARAAAIVAALGPLDVGQGAVVARGVCLGVEAIEGTDLMLERIAALPAERRGAASPRAGVLYKGPKPGQDRRLDLPAIGPATVEGAARAGLAGLVVAAGETLLLEAAATRVAADLAGVFVYGARPSELGQAE